MRKFKHKIKKVAKKVEKKVSFVYHIWKSFVFTVIFLIIMPTFLANHNKDYFYLIVISITGVAVGLISIIQHLFKKNNVIREYIVTGRNLLIIGSILLMISVYVINYDYLKKVLLIITAGFFAEGGRRVGLGYALGAI